MNVVQYLYTGETSVAGNTIQEFLDTARKLKILGLSDEYEYQTDDNNDSDYRIGYRNTSINNDDDTSNLRDDTQDAESPGRSTSVSTIVSKRLRSSPPDNDRSKIKKNVKKIEASTNNTINTANVTIRHNRSNINSAKKQTTKLNNKQKTTGEKNGKIPLVANITIFN